MKFSIALAAVVLGAAVAATTASACGFYHATANDRIQGVQSQAILNQSSGSHLTTAATTTTTTMTMTGKTTGG